MEWDWKLDADGIWFASNNGHKIEAVQFRPALEGNPARYRVFEDDVEIINHNNGNPMTFYSMAEIRRWFTSARKVQSILT